MEKKYYLFFLGIREGLLQLVDSIERLIEYRPRTAYLRKLYKKGKVDIPKEKVI